jgi:hypothetical protein
MAMKTIPLRFFFKALRLILNVHNVWALGEGGDFTTNVYAERKTFGYH